MWKLFLFIVFISGSVLCQTEKTINILLDKYYKNLVQNPQRLHYECFSLSLFPFFASNEPIPPLKYRNKKYTGEYCGYYKFKDKEGTHLVFSGLSYFKRKSDPVYRTYRLFFYIKKDGKWIKEMEPIVVRFKLIQSGLYEPTMG